MVLLRHQGCSRFRLDIWPRFCLAVMWWKQGQLELHCKCCCAWPHCHSLRTTTRRYLQLCGKGSCRAKSAGLDVAGPPADSVLSPALLQCWSSGQHALPCRSLRHLSKAPKLWMFNKTVLPGLGGGIAILQSLKLWAGQPCGWQPGNTSLRNIYKITGTDNFLMAQLHTYFWDFAICLPSCVARRCKGWNFSFIYSTSISQLNRQLSTSKIFILYILYQPTIALHLASEDCSNHSIVVHTFTDTFKLFQVDASQDRFYSLNFHMFRQVACLFA